MKFYSEANLDNGFVFFPLLQQISLCMLNFQINTVLKKVTFSFNRLGELEKKKRVGNTKVIGIYKSLILNSQAKEDNPGWIY